MSDRYLIQVEDLHTGDTSVIGSRPTRKEAQEVADRFNSQECQQGSLRSATVIERKV